MDKIGHYRHIVGLAHKIKEHKKSRKIQPDISKHKLQHNAVNALNTLQSKQKKQKFEISSTQINENSLSRNILRIFF